MIIEIFSNTVTGNEPTDLASAQTYFRSEDSGGIEDNLINNFLIQAREAIESATNISLVNRALEIYIDEWIGFLPLGPVDPDSLTVNSGSVNIRGFSFPYINNSSNAILRYDCVAADNKDLTNAIYELASFWYFRGDINDRSIPEKVAKVIKRYTRRTFI